MEERKKNSYKINVGKRDTYRQTNRQHNTHQSSSTIKTKLLINYTHKKKMNEIVQQQKIYIYIIMEINKLLITKTNIKINQKHAIELVSTNETTAAIQKQK